MNASIDRQMIAQFVIMVAVCVGGWVVFVDPKAQELRELERVIAEARSNPVLMNEGSIQMMANRLHDVRQRVEEIEHKNELARDTARFYGLITETAAVEGVVLQRLDPGSRQRTDKARPVEVTSFEMWAEGTYEEIARFLTAIEEIDGFVRHVSVVLTPRQSKGRSFVEARIECEALSFTLPEALAAMLGTEHADD